MGTISSPPTWGMRRLQAFKGKVREVFSWRSYTGSLIHQGGAQELLCWYHPSTTTGDRGNFQGKGPGRLPPKTVQA
jgi:hypothetical protein